MLENSKYQKIIIYNALNINICFDTVGVKKLFGGNSDIK